jgi:molybdenum cofactor cytidylyltransferase
VKRANGLVVAAVLAAGESRRMGFPKPLLPWGETTVLGQTLRNLLASRIHEVLVVTGLEAEAVTREAAKFSVKAIYNPNYASAEMVSSLQVAVRALPPGCNGVLVVLADQPFIPTAVYDQVIAAFEYNEQRIVAPVFEGQRGHPVLFGRRFFSDLLALPPDSAPRDLLRAHPDALYLIPVDSDSILLDLDWPAEYERYRPPAAGEG